MSGGPDDNARRPWVAALLAGVVPGLGHLYVGRPALAIFFALATPGPLLLAAVAGAYRPSVLLPLILIGLGLHVAIWIATAVSAAVLARGKRASYVPTRYNRVAVYAGFALATWVASNAVAEYVRSSILEPFDNPSGTMLPTLLPGDHVLATKVGPVEQRQRGDVVVFTSPAQPNVDFIERIIGLPGDRIRIEDARIYLNGEAQPKRLVETRYAVALNFDGEVETGQLYEETLGTRPYRILQPASACGRPLGAACAFRGREEFVVPPGHVFIMGDNRGHGADSRFELVPLGNIKGHAAVIWLSFSLLEGIRWSRIGQTL